MSREVVCDFFVFSTIYDVDLPAKILEEMSERQIRLDSGRNYGVHILFDEDVYQKDEFYSFPVSKETPFQRRNKNMSENERKKETMYAILSEQQDNIDKALEKAGISLKHSSIIGEEYLTPSFVDVIIFTDDFPSYGVTKNVMPSRRGFYKNLEKALKSIEDARLSKQKREERKKEERTPHFVRAEDLFAEIAKAMHPSDDNQAILYKEMLYKTAIQISEWPFQLKSGVKIEKNTSINEDTKLDCPEYVIFTQYTTGEWSIDQTANLKTAQATIVKQGYNLKRTDRMIVIHNMKTVPYTLFKETDEGLVMIPPEDARGQKKLHLCWNK